MTIKGKLAGWHNISTNSNVNLNGISAQDILSIIKSISNDPRYITWKDSLEFLYTHISDRNNPHNLTVDQLNTTVIQLIYEAWLTEGYSGELQYFIDLLFRYLEYADEAIMAIGISETHIPPVAIVVNSIDVIHNTHPDAHDNILKQFFAGNSNTLESIFAVHQMLGSPQNYANYFTMETNYYENVPFCEGWASDEFSFVFSVEEDDRPIFQIHSQSRNILFRVDVNPTTKTVIFYRGIYFNPPYNPIRITQYLHFFTDNLEVHSFSFNYTESKFKGFITFKEDVVTYGIEDQIKIDRIPLLQKSVSLETENIIVPLEPRPPLNPKLSFYNVRAGSCLIDLVGFRKALSIDNIYYITEALNEYVLDSSLTPADEMLNQHITHMFWVEKNGELRLYKVDIPSTYKLNDIPLSTYSTPMNFPLLKFDDMEYDPITNMVWVNEDGELKLYLMSIEPGTVNTLDPDAFSSKTNIGGLQIQEDDIIFPS